MPRSARGRARSSCVNPHNPTGTSHAPDALRALAELAERHGAVVVSDEIHAPLPRRDNVVTPFLSVSDAAARCGYAIVSASKAFNLAGLKCAIMVAASEGTHAVLRSLPEEVSWRTGLFGALATVAALSPESDAWLDAQALAIDANTELLRTLLEEHLPDAGYRPPTRVTSGGWISPATAGGTRPRVGFSARHAWRPLGSCVRGRRCRTHPTHSRMRTGGAHRGD